jgi:hypothetical protein
MHGSTNISKLLYSFKKSNKTLNGIYRLTGWIITEEMFVQIEGGRASSHRDDSGSVPGQSMWECVVAKVATRQVFLPKYFGLPLIK